jgi:translation initiation factor IF-3
LKGKKETLPLINEQIRASTVQLITQDGVNIGVLPKRKALEMAEEAGLDLVLIAERGKDDVAVVKIMDFGKVLYEKKKKRLEAKKHQKIVQIKEIKLRPKIGEHDYQTKIKQMVQFLKDGKHVKITLSFRGRESTTKGERGAEFFEKIDQSLINYGLEQNVVKEKETKIGKFWSRVYHLKNIEK